MTNLQPMKDAIYQGILKPISTYREWNTNNQPWLNPGLSTARKTEAATTMKRASQGGGIRSVSISDFGTVLECQKQFAAIYAGVPIKKSAVLNGGKGGTMLHEAIQKMLPNWVITEAVEKRRTMNAKITGGNTKDRSWVYLPSIGDRTTAAFTGKRNDVIVGVIDGYMEPYQTGFELKTVPNGHTLPDELPTRAAGQAAGYAAGLRRDGRNNWIPEAWVWVYLPQDLSTFDPKDTSTYRVFVRTAEELATMWAQVLPLMKEVAAKVDNWGYYGALNFLPNCESQNCPICFT